MPSASLRHAILSSIVVLVFVYLCFSQMNPQNSGDLLALWLAAMEVSAGNPNGIYPPVTDLFTVHPPAHWLDLAASIGYERAVYPYIYPPIWAWVLAPLTRVTDFAGFVAVASLINPALLAGTLLVAHRLTDNGLDRGPRRGLNQTWYLVVGLLLIMPGFGAVVALRQNQPQILVAFLTVLAIERDENRHPLIGGALMGLAAALKVYPALYALVWAVQGRWTALAGFAVVGGALGLASLAVAGWPLHQWFLDLLSMFYTSALANYIMYSFLPALVQVFSPESFRIIEPLIASAAYGGGEWPVAGVPAWASVVSQIAGPAMALAGGLALRRAAPPARPALWAAIMTGLALCAPLSWAYHYLAPLAFLPIVFGAFRFPSAVLLALPVVLSTMLILVEVFTEFSPVAYGGQFFGTLGMTWMAMVFLLVYRQKSRI